MIYLLNIEGIPRLKTKKIEINGLGAGEYGFLRLVCVWELFESDSSNEKKSDLPGLISLFITYK